MPIIFENIIFYGANHMKWLQNFFEKGNRKEKTKRFMLVGALLILAIYTDVRVDTAIREIRSSAQEEVLPVFADTEKYILREYGGRIGIFKAGHDTPSEVLGVYVFTLPKADQNALSVGITVYGSENLRALIEDFTG